MCVAPNTGRIGLAGLFVLLLGGIAPSSFAADAPLHLPFRYEEARVYVPVTVGHEKSPWIILDTGAAPTGIDPSWAARMQLQVESGGTVSGAGAGSSKVGRAANVDLRIGAPGQEIPMHLASAMIVPLNDQLARFTGHEVLGIVGSQFFHEHVVELDFERQIALLHDPASYKPPAGAIAVPFELEGGIPMAQASLTLPSGTVVQGKFVLDLGAKATLLLTEPFIDQHQLRAAFPTQYATGLGAGVGGPTQYAFVRAKQLSVGAASLSAPVVGLSLKQALRSSDYAGLIGGEFFASYRTVFDYARKAMYLLPRKDALVRGFDRSGIFLTADPANFHAIRIQEVAPGTPGDAAKLAAGDMLRKVDGRDVAELTLVEIRARLRGKDPVTLEIERDGARSTHALTLRDLI
ncbi:hypothetical protein TMPK1_05340 [Rhodospirillales bacterium TMPK1]|uniref:PDZ domain-containing protein n=1 Tax=Roseiterribacter gracilis TaxID=2812848 RepID=A0A8S8XAB8_9PROT|nr:hypothetical protein TMPK1_05340 [Rhodospirillales bacterium TMPK1]